MALQVNEVIEIKRIKLMGESNQAAENDFSVYLLMLYLQITSRKNVISQLQAYKQLFLCLTAQRAPGARALLRVCSTKLTSANNTLEIPKLHSEAWGLVLFVCF